MSRIIHNDTSAVALVMGDPWSFDGESARGTISKGWADETTDWPGSDYLCFSRKITFGNNPF